MQLPPGLLPPGDTGCPLIDWILRHPDVGGVVLSHLAPRTVLGLRASCRAAKAAVTAHAWDLPPRTPRYSNWRHNGFTVVGAAALRRWRASFPASRAVVVLGRSNTRRRTPADPRDEVGDEDVAAACAGAAVVVLWGLARVTDAALAALPSPRVLALVDLPGVTSAGWAHMTQLRELSVCRIGGGDGDAITDPGHMAALGGCTCVSLEGVGVVTDAMVAHLASVQRLSLEVVPPPYDEGDEDDMGRFTGAGLAGCGALADLSLHHDAEGYGGAARWPALTGGCLRAAGRSLRKVLLSGVVAGDAVFSGASALAELHLVECPGFTGACLGGLAAVTQLTAVFCDAFVGAVLPPGVTGVQVEGCGAFTGAGLAAGGPRALEALGVHNCARFSVATLTAAAAASPALRSVAYTLSHARAPGFAGEHVITADDAASALGAGWAVTLTCSEASAGVDWRAERGGGGGGGEEGQGGEEEGGSGGSPRAKRARGGGGGGGDE